MKRTMTLAKVQEAKAEKKRKEASCWENLKTVCLMMWDGLGFFGTGHHKLGRLRVNKIEFQWWHKCIEPTEMLILLISIGVFVYIIATEVVLIGTEKGQFSSLIPNDLYFFNASTTMPLHMVSYFEVDELLPRLE